MLQKHMKTQPTFELQLTTFLVPPSKKVDMKWMLLPCQNLKFLFCNSF